MARQIGKEEETINVVLIVVVQVSNDVVVVVSVVGIKLKLSDIILYSCIRF